MAVRRLQIQDFRCLESVDVALNPVCNLIYGDNASGKTSFLEAFAYLARGRSFRGAPLSAVLRHGCDSFVVRAELSGDDALKAMAIQNGKTGLSTRLGAEADVGLAELADVLPLQIIDPDVHELVSGGPDIRRRFIDWVGFHVEHEFVEVWRLFKRALKQRNALLRSGGSAESFAVWDAQYFDAAIALDAARRRALNLLEPVLLEESAALLGDRLGIEYLRGWAEDETLESALAEGLARDRRDSLTHRGPHRAELRIRVDERQAKRLVSRGQQKLLACSMILAACRVVQEARSRPLVLLVDDLVAELDKESQRKLTERCFGLGAQLVLTSLEADMIELPNTASVFHVEHGLLRDCAAMPPTQKA